MPRDTEGAGETPSWVRMGSTLYTALSLRQMGTGSGTAAGRMAVMCVSWEITSEALRRYQAGDLP